MEKLSYINLGCGSTFNEKWVNVDFISTGKDVIAHNLTKGIPFKDNSFKAAYHSHVLEHFTKPDAETFRGATSVGAAISGAALASGTPSARTHVGPLV